MYDLTLLQGSDSGIYQLILFGNDVTSGMLVGGLMISIFFVILFRLSSRNEVPVCILAASFSCFVLSTILAYIKLLGLIFPLVFLALLAFTSLYMFMSRRN